MKRYVSFLRLLIMSGIVVAMQHAAADDAPTRTQVISHDQPLSLTAGQGAGSALVTFICAAGSLLTASNGLDKLNNDLFSSFILLNFTVLFFYTAVQTGLYSMSKFKKCTASFLRGKPCAP